MLRAFRHRGRSLAAGAVVAVSAEEARALVQANRAVLANVGPCTSDTERCDAATDYHQVTPACCRAHVRLIFERMLVWFDALPWWLDYGSVLGAVRHGGMVPHDKDGDIGMMQGDLERVLQLAPAIEAEGFSFAYGPAGKAGEFSGGNSVKVRRSATNHTNVDIFFWHERPDGLLDRKRYIHVDHFKGRAFRPERLLPLSTVDYEGLQLPAPADPEWFCAHRYGPNWRTPIAANNDGRRR